LIDIDKMREASTHLQYEIQMLRFLASELRSRSKEHTAVVNAYVESFAIHLRILRDFFYRDSPGSRDKDDIMAIDYVRSEKDWLSERGVEVTFPRFSGHIERIGLC